MNDLEYLEYLVKYLEYLEYNNMPCNICGKETVFESTQSMPPELQEGDRCTECGLWVCTDCIDWSNMASNETEDVTCIRCSTEG